MTSYTGKYVIGGIKHIGISRYRKEEINSAVEPGSIVYHSMENIFTTTLFQYNCEEPEVIYTKWVHNLEVMSDILNNCHTTHSCLTVEL